MINTIIVILGIVFVIVYLLLLTGAEASPSEDDLSIQRDMSRRLKT